MKITKEFFGKTSKGEAVEKYCLENKNGTKAAVLTYGGILQAFVFRGIDVVLGFDSIGEYEEQDGYIGAIVGRFANRIGGGKFVLNGNGYSLAVNNGPNHLHGGREGFDRKVWQAEAKEDGLHLFYTSPHGEEGYPATLRTQVIYALDDRDSLSIRYRAEGDQDTVLNLTNHSYFNLNGHQSGTIEDHEVTIFAESFTENDENSLPTGKIRRVEGTPMDFRTPQALTARMGENYDQLVYGNGYDHNWIIDGYGLRPFAIAEGKETGIILETESDQPGMQLYTANFLDVESKGKGGAVYPRRSGFCFETQGFPNATEHSHFPTAVLKAGERYERTTIYRLRERV